MLESPLDCKEIKAVNPKGNQFWIFIRRTDAEAEAPILWPPDVKNWLIWKDPDAGKDCRQEEKGMTEDEMVGWHHRLYGHEFEQAPGVGDGQGSLACCRPWSRKEWDTAERLNWTELTGIFPRWPRWQRSCLQCRRSTFYPWVRKIPWIKNGNPLQYSSLKNSMDRGPWQSTVHGSQGVRHD